MQQDTIRTLQMKLIDMASEFQQREGADTDLALDQVGFPNLFRL